MLSSVFKAEEMDRTGYIGGSDMTALLRLAPYDDATPYALYRTKIGNPLPRERNDLLAEAAEWGHRLEPVLRARYSETRPLVRVSKPEEPSIDVEHSFFTCRPDGIVYAADSAPAWGWEGKNRSNFKRNEWGESGTADIPASVFAQVQWSMMVTRLQRWDVSVLLGGNEYREYSIPANPEYQAEIRATALDFWRNHVLARVEPIAWTLADCREKFANGGPGKVQVPAGDPLEAVVSEYVALGEALSAVSDLRDAAQVQIREAIGQEGGLVTTQHMVHLAAASGTRQRRLTVTKRKVEP